MTSVAVLFDLDGTLALSESLHHRALSDVLIGLGLRPPIGFDVAMTGQAIQVVHQALVHQIGLPLDLPAFASAKYRAYLGRMSELRWRPGAREAVEAARASGCGVAVVTNSDRMLLDASLRQLGWVWPDQVSVSRNDVRCGKPDPEPYLRAAWLMGISPAQCVVVEDSAAGALSGLRAGMRVLAWPEASQASEFPVGAHVLREPAIWPALKSAVQSISFPLEGLSP